MNEEWRFQCFSNERLKNFRLKDRDTDWQRHRLTKTQIDKDTDWQRHRLTETQMDGDTEAYKERKNEIIEWKER